MGYVKKRRIGRNTYTTEDFHGTVSPHWESQQIFLEMTRRKRNLMTISQFHRKQLTLRNGSMIRMQKTGTIVKSAGSRIGILANEIICNHDLRYKTWKLY